MRSLLTAHFRVNGTKVVEHLDHGRSWTEACGGKSPIFCLIWLLAWSSDCLATGSAGPILAASQSMHWPVLTGLLAIALLFLTWWQQARHRRHMEDTNAELRRSEEEVRRAFAALRENEQLLTSILENISEAVYRTSVNRELIFVNRAYLKMFGFSSLEELRSVPRERLYASADDRARLLKLIDEQGGYASQEIEYRRQDGTTFWGLASSTAVYEPGTQRVAYHVGAITNITERKKAENEVRQLNQDLERRIAERTAELRASEAQFRTLVENAPEAIVVFDGDTGRFLTGNENALRIFGTTRDQLTQLTPADVSPLVQPNGKLSGEWAAELIQRACAGETPVFEWTHRSTAGRLTPCEVRLVRLPAEGRRLLRASILDTSERRHRERIQQATYRISEAVHAAEDLESLYRRIHEVIRSLMPADNFYIALLDPATDIISFPYFVDQLASGPPEPRHVTTGLTGYVLRTGKTLLLDRSKSERKTQVADAVLVEGMELPYIESGRPAAIWLGTPLTFRGRTLGVMAVQDYDNENAYGEDEQQVLTFIADQTALAIERKRTERAVRESEEKYRALFSTSGQGVMLHDENHFLEVNPAAVRILGYESPAQLIGKHPSETSAPTQPGGEAADVLARQHIATCIRTGSARFEWLSRTPAGREIPLEVILTRVQMGGRPMIQAVVNDITERKRAEAELLNALAREKELSALKTNFVSMVSHEFRTPLGVIMSSAQILDDYFERLDSGERREHLQAIQKHTRRMANLMEEVLLLSRVEAGKLGFHPQPLDLGTLARRLIDEVLLATNRRCAIDLTVDPAFCRDPKPQVTGDEGLLAHILTNLLSNAVKYSPDNARVRVDIVPRGARICFTIQDHGIGIPEKDQDWLFNAFQRATNVGNRPGTGLGLVIVKRCVELHHGTIRIESAVGQGTTVEVALPMLDAASAAPPASPVSAHN